VISRVRMSVFQPKPAALTLQPLRTSASPDIISIMSRVAATIFALVVCVAAFASSGFSQQRQPLKFDEKGNPYPETATSFDCKKATSNVEQLICHDYILAMADGSMGEQLWFMKRELTTQQWADVVRSQRAWLQRRNACRDSKCVEAAYEARSSELDKIWDGRDRYLKRNVSRLGECEKTTVEWIGPRLQEGQGEEPDGTSIRFADAVRQVSYDRELEVLSSRVGDPARVCLIKIPKGCPPGDNRGRVYRVTNLRTGKRWELPDSSHECGGG